jgi:hypothetical protein
MDDDDHAAKLLQYRFLGWRTRIVGADVLRVEYGTDGLGLYFEGGWRVGIYGAARLLADHVPVELERVPELAGRALTQFAGNAAEERLGFSGEPEFELVVTLDLDQCAGPEAMVLYGPDDLIVVWN